MKAMLGRVSSFPLVDTLVRATAPACVRVGVGSVVETAYRL